MASLDITSSITLNVTKPNSGVVLYAKQFDKLTRKITISLVNGTEVWNPPTNCEIVVMCFKPDGTKAIFDVANSEPYYDAEKTYLAGDRVRQGGSIYSCTQDINTPEVWNPSHWQFIANVTPAMSRVSSGTYLLTLSDQALSAAGMVLVELSFYTTELRATTLSFMINVEKSVPDNETLTSSDYFNVLTGLIQGLLGSAAHSPYIDPTTKNWMLWNDESQTYEDSGESSVGIQGERGYRGYGVVDVVRVNQTPAGPGEVNTYKLEFEDGSFSENTFNVREGRDGSGSPGDVDPQPLGAVASAGTANAYSRQDHVHPVASQALFDAIYPIGSIYMSMSPTSPSILFGGYWVKLVDTFLLGAGNTYSARALGGEPTHLLTVNEMPSHQHALRRYNGNGESTGTAITLASQKYIDAVSAVGTMAAGGGQPHNNMPPYYAVYMGERIDPHVYNHNMALIEGEFYEDNGAVYRCIQDTVGAVTVDLSTLDGTYVALEEYW